MRRACIKCNYENGHSWHLHFSVRSVQWVLFKQWRQSLFPPGEENTLLEQSNCPESCHCCRCQMLFCSWWCPGNSLCLILALSCQLYPYDQPYLHCLAQALLTKVWWGAMRTDNAISRLVLTFFIPPLIWTSLIKFKWVFLWLLIPCMAFKLIFDSLSVMSIYMCVCVTVQ